MGRPLLIFVDTNVAIYEAYFFRKKGGPELLALMKAIGARFVVPDILHKEFVDNFRIVASNARREAQTALSKLETAWSRKLATLLPNQDYAEEQVAASLAQLKDVTLHVPESDELLLAAARRSKENRAPCSKTDHGFKDCLIWESVLSVAAGADLRIVTRDGGYYDDEEIHLATNIKAEASAKGIVVRAYRGKEKEKEKSRGRGRGQDDTQALYDLIADLQTDYKEAISERNESKPLDHSPGEQTLPPLPPATEPLDLASDAAGAPTASTLIEAGQNADEELAQLLSISREKFSGLEAKALGFIAYLGGEGKDRLFEVLEAAGIDRSSAANVCDRLALSDLVHDTGNNFLPVPGRASDIAAALVEGEVIKLIRGGK